MSIRIFTDSASDITREELEELQVELIAMPLQCGEETYVDDKTTPVETFWQMLLDGVNIKTSLPSPDTFVQKFEAAKAAGDENVYFLSGENFYGEYGKDTCTVDNCHPNDLGFYCMAKAIRPLLSELLERGRKK